jgi:radical SAM superfamily enzyme YgiQ (UPF0313 family)
MKLCLISPPTVTDFEKPEVAESEAVRLIAEHAPIGILSLAAVLEERCTSPSIVDLNRLYYDYLRGDEYRQGKGDFCDFVVSQFESRSFDLFGFSTICSSYPLTLRMARGIKRTHPEAIVVLGGPQASVVDVQTLRAFPFIDFIVRGEAEETLPSLLDAISGAHSYDTISGITFRRGENVVRNPNAPVIHDLDGLPMPAFHLYPHLKSCGYVPLELGRGCPFACSFCSTNDFFRRQFRLKSPERIIEQMKLIKEEYGINSFDLIHDMFTVDRRRVVEFCEALRRCGDKFYWGCSARTDCVDDELIALMARAGCRGIFFGIETGSDRMQRRIDKRLDLAEAALMIKSANKRRINTTVSLIIGFPEETKKDVSDTVGFLVDSLRFDHAEPQLHLLAPLAETPITTRYKDALIFDEIFSDMSHQGWQQDPADLEMIKSHPDIFPNFYALPTEQLERTYLKELREFVLNVIARFRWLVLALHQDSGDLLGVFDRWKAWYSQRETEELSPGANPRTYYSSDVFQSEFLCFLQSRYLSLAHRATSVSVIVAYENALDDLRQRISLAGQECDSEHSSRSAPLEFDAMARLAKGVYTVQLDADYQRLIRCLRRKGRLDQVPARPVTLAVRDAGEKLKILQLSDLSSRLLGMCDGTLTVRQVIDRFATTEGSLGGIPAESACVFGLESLRQQKLITTSSTQ